jgi:hypothetical protein
MNRVALQTVTVTLLWTGLARPCSVVGKISATDMVKKSDAIVRAQAVEYAEPPAGPGAVSSGPPDSRVRFRVLERVRGAASITTLALPGSFVDTDDFNDQPPPYNFVRPAGRAGSCFATSYRQGAEYLLFLKKEPSGELTLSWYPLGPVNEQLHSARDPWLLWARKQSRNK